MALLPFFPIQQRGGSGTSRHRGPLTSLLTAGAMSGFAGGAGPSGLDRMPSIPTDALLDADDLDLLTSGLTVADAPDDPRIRERRSLFAWIEAQGRDLGRSYVSSVERYYNV